MIYVNGTSCTILAISALLPCLVICMASLMFLILNMERLVSRICVERILSGSALQGTLFSKVILLVFCHYVGYRHQLRRRHYR